MAAGTRLEWESGAQAAARTVAPATMAERLAQVIERGAQHLLSLQAEEGYWIGELEADTTLESDYIYYLNVLGRAEPGRISKLARYVRQRQLPDGGWNTYFDGPSNLNATVKAYFALKIAGDSIDAPHMIRAKEAVHGLGGLEWTNSYVRFNMALVGALGWDMTPAIPPELMLFPNWFNFNIYEMSSWTRGFLVPMSILYAIKPRWTLPMNVSVDELFATPGRKAVAFDWD
jgi:squalene-hopene/tetraprenyl-beta-curcumene cyclase